MYKYKLLYVFICERMFRCRIGFIAMTRSVVQEEPSDLQATNSMRSPYTQPQK